MVTVMHRCPVCSKTFPSDKGLHGHMRLHPKGLYRGVNPHSKAKKSKAAPTKCSASGSDDGEESGSDADTSAPPANSQGQCKQILSFRTGLEAFYKDWGTEEYYDGDGSQYEARYIRTLDLEEYDPRFRRFCKRLISELALEKEEEGGIKTISPTIAMSCNDMSNAAATKTNATKKRKVDGVERNTSNGGRHMCVTCKKTFNSHQALGGHQTLHRQKADASSPPAAAKEIVEAKAHICKICKREFKSGQALGGHQRLHYQGPPLYNSSVKGEVEKSRSGSSSASSHGSLGSAANGDDFDYEYEEGEIPPSWGDSAAVQLKLEMQVEEDEGSEGHNLAASQSKLEMQVEVEDEVGSKGCGIDLNESSNNEAEEVVGDGEEKGAMVTSQTHVDPRSNHAQQERNINLPPPQSQVPGKGV